MGDAGNAAVHRCIYHGWAFRPDGSFIGAPVEREQMHGDIRQKSELGLRKARVAIYGGMIFATWSEEAPEFEVYLGDMKFYLDMRSEEHTSELQSLTRISYAVFCLKKKKR